MTINKKEVPVLLLTGYLGSGKTTLLNRILSNEKGIKFAVIVNDIGEVNIDADLIQQGGIVNREAPLSISNVMYLHNGKATRIGFQVTEENGKTVKKRVAKSTGEVID